MNCLKVIRKDNSIIKKEKESGWKSREYWR